MNVTVVDI